MAKVKRINEMSLLRKYKYGLALQSRVKAHNIHTILDKHREVGLVIANALNNENYTKYYEKFKSRSTYDPSKGIIRRK